MNGLKSRKQVFYHKVIIVPEITFKMAAQMAVNTYYYIYLPINPVIVFMNRLGNIILIKKNNLLTILDSEIKVIFNLSQLKIETATEFIPLNIHFTGYILFSRNLLFQIVCDISPVITLSQRGMDIKHFMN